MLAAASDAEEDAEAEFDSEADAEVGSGALNEPAGEDSEVVAEGEEDDSEGGPCL